MVETDLDLVQALRGQQPGAFDRLYHRYSDRIWRLLFRLAGSSAEDLFQDTWIAAARNAHLLREETALLPWLFTIAHNKYRNGVRGWARRARLQQDLGCLPQAAPVAVDESADQRRQIAQARAAFQRLPEAHREVLVLCVAEGLDAAEAATVLGCTDDAVRKRLSRARAALAQEAGQFTEGEKHHARRG